MINRFFICIFHLILFLNYSCILSCFSEELETELDENGRLAVVLNVAFMYDEEDIDSWKPLFNDASFDIFRSSLGKVPPHLLRGSKVESKRFLRYMLEVGNHL